MGKVKFKRKRSEVILTVFAWLSLFAAIIFSVAAIFATFSGTTNGKLIFGHKLLIVESDSMSKSEISEDEPIFFNVDDVIIIQEVGDYSSIKVGDVITFVSYNDESRGKTISHKVRSIKTTSNGTLVGFETYGINTGVSDQAIVEPDAIIGKYVNKIPEIGKLFRFFKTPGGFFLSISIPCLLLIIFFSIEVGKQLGKKQLSDSYDNQMEKLRERLANLENLPEGEIMQVHLHQSTSANTAEQQSAERQEVVAEQPVNQGNSVNACTPPPQFMGQTYFQAPMFFEKPLEITLNSFSKTVETLTHTIESLAANATKPVDTLVHTIETLAGAVVKPTVVEKTVTQPIVQPVIIEAPKASVETTTPVAPVEPVEVTPVTPAEVVDEKPVEVDKPIEQAEIEVATTVVVDTEPVIEEPVEQVEEIEVAEVEETEPVIEQEDESTVEESEEEEETEEELFGEEVQEEVDPLTFKLNNLRQRAKISFSKKLLSLAEEIKGFFTEIHNELVSYKKVSYRISFKGITYRVSRKSIAKMVVRGRTLKLHLALDVNDYPKTVYFQESLEHIKAYQDVPFTVKVKSKRGKNNAIKLIISLAEKNGYVKKEGEIKENILKQLKLFK